jgi:cytochrome c556
MKNASEKWASLNRYLGAGFLLAALAIPAAAASLKGVMGSMGDTTASAKAVLSNFDSQTASQVLRHYTDDVRRADAFVAAGSSAKEQDFHARFNKLIEITGSASQKSLDKTSFRETMTAVITECKSCHSKYD